MKLDALGTADNTRAVAVTTHARGESPISISVAIVCDQPNSTDKNANT